MNLDQLTQSFQQNRTAILGTAAAGVVGVALYKRKQAAGGGAAAPAAAAAPAGYSAGGQTAGMYGAGAYDSSASDVYGLVQPQLESLGSQLTGLSSKLNQVPVSQAPAPATSNAQWLSSAETAWMQQDPTRNVTDIQGALVPWLNGQQVGAGALGGINWAVANFGAPPQGTAGVSPVIAPATK